MAESNLTTCRDCGESVSNKAKICPHCGANKPWKRPRKGIHPAWKVLMVLLVIALVGEVIERLSDSPTTAKSSITGTTMYVYAELANLRESASSDAPVVMQLRKGHQLVVFERQGSWYSVGAHRTRGKTGWIHSSVIGDLIIGGNPVYEEG